MDWFDSISSNLLEKDLDGLWLRQQTISENIANVETPNYKSKTVNFEDTLTSLLSSNPNEKQLIEGIDETEATIVESDNETLRTDGNNVDVENENIELARTQLNYLYSLRGLTDYYSRIRYAVTDGKS